MKRSRTLIVIGCACVAMMMSTTAFAMPGATSLVTVEPKTAASQDQNINATAQSTEAAQTVSLEAMGQAQPPIPPTEAERLSALEAAMLELMMGGTGGG